MTKEEAEAEEEKGNYEVEEEPGRFRRIIAAPMPIDIYEIDAVKALLDADQIVIAAFLSESAATNLIDASTLGNVVLAGKCPALIYW